MYWSKVLSLKITFLYSSPRSPINFSKALSVGAKTVNGPGDCSASVNPALPKRKIREIKIHNNNNILNFIIIPFNKICQNT